MPAFSKPVPPSAAIETTQTGRKRTLNPKLTSEDNVHADAVKRRKIQQAKSGNSTTSGSRVINAEPRNPTPPAKKTKATTKAKAKAKSHQASVEDTSDEDSIDASRNDGHPKNPNANLGAADVSEDDDEEEEANVDDIQEETNEQELGIVKIQSWNCFINFLFRTTSKRMALTNLCIFQTRS